MVKFSSHILILFFFTSLAQANPVQWKIADGGNDHFYEVKVDTNGITWPQANAIANSSGGYLASITTQAENDFIYNLSIATTNAWNINGPGNNDYGPYIGGIQIAGSVEPANGWAWENGEAFIYTNWLTGEPNNSYGVTPGLNENVIHFLNGKSWNDTPDVNSGEIHSFVIEYPSTFTVPIPNIYLVLLFLIIISSIFTKRFLAIQSFLMILRKT